MTWLDPIVDEVRRVRDAYAARFNYDLRAIFRDLKEQESRSGRKFVAAPIESRVAAVPLEESPDAEHTSSTQAIATAHK